MYMTGGGNPLCCIYLSGPGSILSMDVCMAIDCICIYPKREKKKKKKKKKKEGIQEAFLPSIDSVS